MGVEHAAQADELVHRAAEVVPVLGQAGDGAQRALLAAAADADRRVRRLHGLGLAVAAVDGEVLALVAESGLGQQADDHVAGLVEPVHALAHRQQVDAVGVGLVLVPPGAEPQLEPTARHDVDRRGHVGQHRRVAVRRARHHDADPDAGRGLGQRRERGPALEARLRPVAVDRLEVVERPGRLEQLDLVGGPPEGEHVLPGRLLGGGLDGEAHGVILAQRRPARGRLRPGARRCANVLAPWMLRPTPSPRSTPGWPRP